MHVLCKRHVSQVPSNRHRRWLENEDPVTGLFNDYGVANGEGLEFVAIYRTALSIACFTDCEPSMVRPGRLVEEAAKQFW